MPPGYSTPVPAGPTVTCLPPRGHPPLVSFWPSLWSHCPAFLPQVPFPWHHCLSSQLINIHQINPVIQPSTESSVGVQQIPPDFFSNGFSNSQKHNLGALLKVTEPAAGDTCLLPQRRGSECAPACSDVWLSTQRIQHPTGTQPVPRGMKATV